MTDCASCERPTPSASGQCIYCGCPLDGRRHLRKCEGCGWLVPVVEGCGRCEDAPAPAPAPRAAPSGRRPRPRPRPQPKARRRRQAEPAHYLIVNGHEPLELEPGRPFRIGRDVRSDLVVTSQAVSREHAEVFWDRHERPLVREIRSQNGTTLNGRTLPRGSDLPLRSGDAIELGGAFAVLYFHARRDELQDELAQREALETRRLGERPPPPPTARFTRPVRGPRPPR